jgi:hypothetical protein
MTSFTDCTKYHYRLNRIFYMQMTERLGTDGLYWYCRFNMVLLKMISAFTEDDISIYDFASFSSLFFFLQDAPKSGLRSGRGSL